MNTNYLLHEPAYVIKRARGDAGWSTDEQSLRHWEHLREWLGTLDPSSRILEVGCGAGDQSIRLAQDGALSTGIDISPAAIKWASDKAVENGLPERFVRGSVLQLPFADASFDHVLDGLCWHCIIGEDRGRFLQEIRRVLVPGGRFTGVTMVNGSTTDLPGYDPVTRQQSMSGAVVRYWAQEDEVFEALASAGFDVTRSALVKGDDYGGEDMLFVDAMRGN